MSEVSDYWKPELEKAHDEIRRLGLRIAELEATKQPAASSGQEAGDVERLVSATKAAMTELWWCAKQLGLDWKDKEWRGRSSVGRAYDNAQAAIAAMSSGGSAPAPDSGDCRKAFENWCERKKMDMEGSWNTWTEQYQYRHSHIDAMWQGFQAAWGLNARQPGEAGAVDERRILFALQEIEGLPAGFNLRLILDAIRPYLLQSGAAPELTEADRREARSPWISTKDKLPEKPGLSGYEQIDCLVIYKRERRHLVWNCEHLCWDDASGDDFFCNPLDVDFWMPFPDMPPATDRREGE